MWYNTPYQICYIIVSLIASWIFISFTVIVLRHIMFNPARLKQYHVHKPMLILATLTWVSLGFKNIIQALLLNNFIIPFDNKCSQKPACLQCHISAKLSIFFIIMAYAFILSLFANALKANFLPLCSNKFRFKLKYYIIQSWIIILTLLAIVQLLFESDTNFEVMELSDNTSKCTCRRKKHLGDDDIFVRGLLVMVFITLIIIVSIFLYKSYGLFRQTSSQISKTNFAKTNSFIKVKRLMDAIVRNAIISGAIILSPFMFRVLPYFINKEIDLSPIAELITGTCIYMLFRFGNRKYKRIFGYFHRKILTKWLIKHQLFFSSDNNNINREDNPVRKHSDSNLQPPREQRLSFAPPSTASLPTIHETSLERRAEEILNQNDLDIDIGDAL